VERFDPTPGRLSQLASSAVAVASRVLMQGLNRVDVVGQASFDAARASQGPGRGLLTFSNHVGLFDDPWLLACFAGPEWSGLRWVTADALNFFDRPWKAALFSAGKAVPIVRGVGLEQFGMDFLAERLQAGEWVHIFPEGGRTREAEGRLRTPLKPGIAHLIRAARPVLLPFHHLGMHEVLPIGARVPRVGRTVTLRFGDARASSDGLADQDEARIMAWVEEQLLALEAQTLGSREPPAAQPILAAP
jgi:monolysocardiolipin acyltransferase